MRSDPPSAPPSGSLARQLGVWGATFLGLGSILGTGVFVSLGLGADAAGPAVLVAIVLAGALAFCNATSSAQLAASHPVAGGTYEYGYRYLNPSLGFAAGTAFLLAKGASASTAALGIASYLVEGLGLELPGFGPHALAAAITLVLTAVVLGGIRRTSAVNVVVTGVTLLALAAFMLGGSGLLFEDASGTMRPLFAPVDTTLSPTAGLLRATALCFVAYTGYGRVATLGEEVRNPQRTLPRAILMTLAVSAVLFLGVAAIALLAVGAPALARLTHDTSAPLVAIARERAGFPAWVAPVVAVGAVTAMLGVLLNLVLGLSRVLLAMGRRGDLPRSLARVDATGTTPGPAVLVTGVAVALVAGTTRIETSWSFSAFTVLIYYGLTNLAALRLPPAARRFPPALAWCGLLGCVSIAVWVEAPIALAGGAALLAALAWPFLRARTTRT